MPWARVPWKNELGTGIQKPGFWSLLSPTLLAAKLWPPHLNSFWEIKLTKRFSNSCSLKLKLYIHNPPTHTPRLKEKEDKKHGRDQRGLTLNLNFILFCFVFAFGGPHLWHMEVPRLGVELERQLLAYATATAVPDPSRICDPHHSSHQCQILDPRSEARDRTCIFMDPSGVC